MGEIVMALFENVYNCKCINLVKDCYWENAVTHYICDEDFMGYDEIQGN